MACGISVPQLGIEPTLPAVKAWSLNHWPTREVPSLSNTVYGFFIILVHYVNGCKISLIYCNLLCSKLRILYVCSILHLFCKVGSCLAAPCTPASPALAWPNKEPRVSNRDVSRLRDGGSFVSEARSLSDTLPCAADDRQDTAIISATWGRRRLPYIEGIDIRWAHPLPGKPAGGHGVSR